MKSHSSFAVPPRWSLVRFLAILISMGAINGADSVQAAEPQSIVYSQTPSNLELFAAREIRRIVYLRTGRLLPMEQRANLAGQKGSAIVIGGQSSPLGRSLAQTLHLSAPELKAEQYWLKSTSLAGHELVVVYGGDPVGTLYGTYRLAEHWGVRFYLHGEVVPDEQQPLQVPALDELGKPLFQLRGIQPFHDFPEGPDWWNRDDYFAVIAQLPKLRMNFIGLHTYPEGGPNAEPTVWIGPASEIGTNGGVKASYPASYQNTLRGNWGYAPKKTSDYSCGAAGLFERDDFGADVMEGFIPQPDTSNGCNLVFERTADLLRAVFEEAHRLGVRTCVGTETPLTVPKRLRERLESQGKDPNDRAVIQELYEGIYRRIGRAYPLDYYWFWTPEGWTWEGTHWDQVARTTNDLFAAIDAYRKVRPSFALATCGWVLGPQQDRALFDKVLPKDVAVSCINRQVGHTPVDKGFAQVSGRSKWAIPWLEDDGALTAPQLWAGRMRRDAFDAHRYGCDGLMGIHWRTRVLGPAVSALAQASWAQGDWAIAGGTSTNEAEPGTAAAATGVFPPTDDFYRDWAKYQFGDQIGLPAAKLFARIDGRLPRPSEWVDGPGGLKPDPRPWEEVQKEYAFVDEFSALERSMRGAGNSEPYRYWLDTFRNMRATAELRCVWARYTAAVGKAKEEKDPAGRRVFARNTLLPLRREMVNLTSEMYRHLLSFISNPGELGAVMNWESHIVPGLLTGPGDDLAAMLGEPLPPDAQLPKSYRGPTRIIVPTVRTSFHRVKPLSLKVLILAEAPPRKVTLHWRTMGRGRFATVPLQRVGRGVYQADFPGAATAGDALEYYLDAVGSDRKNVHWPVTAPAVGQTLTAFEG